MIITTNHVIDNVETKLEIRPAKPLEIWPYVEQASKERIRFGGNVDMFICTDWIGNVIGFCAIDFQGKKAVFKNDYVLPQYRRNGIWEKMFKYRKLVVSVRPGIERIEATCTDMSLPLYIAQGAKIIKEYKDLTKVRIDL